MNILHLEASTGWGGQEIRILREAVGMRSRGHTVLFSVMRGAVLGERARLAGFEVCELNFFRRGWFKTLFQLIRWIRKHRVELVNTHSSLDAWIGGIAARCAGAKIVRTRHLSGAVRPGWNSRMLYGALADFVVTTCQAAILPLAKQSGRPLESFRSIATGVDPEAIQVDPAAVAKFRSEIGAKFLIGTACVMRSWKGVDDLLKAADLLRDVEGVKWVVIGGGHAERHHRLAKELKLEGIVHFTGHLENPFPAIAALDAFALLSTANEGVSQAILQAAYLGKPLIATRTGGLCEVCIEEETGISVQPFQPREVADAAVKLAGNPEICARFGRQAKELVCKQFTFLHTLDGMEEIYRTVLANDLR